MTARPSLSACLDAAELLIMVAIGVRMKPREAELDLLAERAQSLTAAVRGAAVEPDMLAEFEARLRDGRRG